ncbi:MAG: HAD family phosphatase [Chlamydiales bacterium]|nr:HAD family phosphatase [Chlamydiia bacterium]MCP5507178.1 HAD family phosphatase [Chlamydiales bacterium]
MIDTKRLKALFIDLDGTLVDSIPVLFSVYKEFLAKYDIHGSQKEFDELSGPALPEIMAVLKERYHLDQDVGDLVEEYQEILYTHYTQNLRLFSGARSFLKLAGSLGIKLVLVTSATAKLATAFLNAEGISGYFDDIISGNDVEKGKPDPAIYHRALFRTGINADEALVIEDSKNGIAAATGAGIRALFLTHGNSHVTGIGKSMVSQVADWNEIAELFKVWYEQV